MKDRILDFLLGVATIFCMIMIGLAMVFGFFLFLFFEPRGDRRIS